MRPALPPQFPINLRRGVSFRRSKGNIPVLRFHYACHPERNPDRHPEWLAAERRKYTSQASWDREQEIVDEAGGGELVFADTLLNHWNKIVITDPAWRPDPVSYEGRFYRIPRSYFAPKPVQAGGPPVLIAAVAPPTAARAGL